MKNMLINLALNWLATFLIYVTVTWYYVKRWLQRIITKVTQQ